METCLFFILGWISALSGVALGGWLVYRTKRDSYDPLFAGQPQGDSFNIDDDFSLDDPEPSKAQPTKAVEKMNSRFVDQFATSLADKAGKA